MRRVGLSREGDEGISAEEFEAMEPNDKINVFEVVFPNGHLETGWVKNSDYDRTIIIEYKTPFKLAPNIQILWENLKSVECSTEKAVIEYESGWGPHIPYTVIGIDIDEAPATYNLAEALQSVKDELAQDALVKAGIASAIGVGGGAGVSKLTR